MKSLNYKLIILGLLCLNYFTNCKKTVENELKLVASNKSDGSLVATVAKDGSGNFTNVQAAVNAAPDYGTKPFIIYVKKGTYNENLKVPKTKITLHFKGDSADSTFITFDSQTPGDNYLVNIPSSIFTAEDISFETGIR
jgi:pectin methylesterase-like acyl-CoA thioesterase